MLSQILKLADYQIIVGHFQKALNKLLLEKNYSKISILVDENTQKYCLPILLKSHSILQNATIICIESGEIHKNLATCQQIWQQLFWTIALF